MSSNNGIRATSAVDPVSDAAIAKAALADTPEDQVSKCNNEAHAKVLQKLMDLYHDSGYKRITTKNVREEWGRDRFGLDKHDMHHLFETLDMLYSTLENICQEAKQANPELKMIKVSYDPETEEYIEEGGSDSDEEE